MTTRREFPGRIKAAAFLRAAGHCEGCGMRLSVGKYHYDHARADQLLGEPTLENCAVLCLGCHDEKTKQDVSRISRAKRQERAHIGARKPATMPGSRNSKWKRRMDGSVERR